MANTYLSAQLEVRHYYRNLATAYHQYAEHKEQKTEKVVKLVLPDGRKDEEQFDENGPEWQNTGHQHAES